MKLRVAAATLGCKVNQVETASLLEALEDRGLEVCRFRDQADVYLVNTCAVTARAAYESRQLVRRALRRRPLLVLATGCYAQVFPAELLERAGGPVLVVGQALKPEIPEIIARVELPLRQGSVLSGDLRAKRACPRFPLRRFPGRSRAFLRVQDGCDSFCAYCIVPHARGPARSLPLAEVVAQARVFAAAGYREIVLTGTHLGLWGRDLSPPAGLTDLLRALLELEGFRVRLSSLEPGELSRELLLLGRRSGRLVPHFHLSLQSGDDGVLARMGRRYRAADFEALVREIKEVFPEAAVGADVIAGFPGEDEGAFARTLSLLERLPLAYLHVFPYSPRPGTRAAAWPQVPPHLVARRARALLELSRARRKAFLREQVGRRLEVLVQGFDEQQGLYRGLSENYVRVCFPGPPGLTGQIVACRGERPVGEVLYARIENG